jgi:DNA repair protein RadC
MHLVGGGAEPGQFRTMPGLGTQGTGEQVWRLASPMDGFALFASLAWEERERIAVAYLDARHGVLAIDTGAPDFRCSAAIPLSRLLRDAVRYGAAALLVVHNHPGGDPMPSMADIQATRHLAEAARAIGVRLLDHLVVARGGSRSLRLMGML